MYVGVMRPLKASVVMNPSAVYLQKGNPNRLDLKQTCLDMNRRDMTQTKSLMQLILIDCYAHRFNFVLVNTIRNIPESRPFRLFANIIHFHLK